MQYKNSINKYKKTLNGQNENNMAGQSNVKDMPGQKLRKTQISWF